MLCLAWFVCLTSVDLWFFELILAKTSPAEETMLHTLWIKIIELHSISLAISWLSINHFNTPLTQCVKFVNTINEFSIIEQELSNATPATRNLLIDSMIFNSECSALTPLVNCQFHVKVWGFSRGQEGSIFLEGGVHRGTRKTGDCPPQTDTPFP